jgi:hypothetical protein
MNYNVFDPFLARDTWHTFHPLDEKVFFQCLHKVVHDPEFSPEAMGDYIRNARRIDEESPFAEDVRTLVSKAWTVRSYLEAAGKL